MNIHTSVKATTANSSSKQCPSQLVQNKANVKHQPHKINPLYETPFNDVVTNEYVRGYN